MTTNYVVWTRAMTVRTACETKAQVWEVIGNLSFGALYEVYSSTGKDCSEFIPF